ncbi:MAG: hypothetical protein EON93_06060 [Burkholderiales bacterium]|nr:MAG: hypothetical protein EON93_06060 [Burkholderiales bacterium]
MADVLRGVADHLAGITIMTYCDNLGIICARERVSVLEEQLRDAFKRHGAGPFELSATTPINIRTEFRFLGYWWKISCAGAEVFVPPEIAETRLLSLGQEASIASAAELRRLRGYRTPRDRVLKHVADNNIQNLIVLTGDEHVHYAGEIHRDGRKAGKKAVGVEFTATSITSGGDGQDQTDNDKVLLSINPQLKFVNRQRGYMVCDVTPERSETSAMSLDKVSVADGKLTKRATLTVPRGSNTLSVA